MCNLVCIITSMCVCVWCTDINECTQGLSNCSNNATCTDVAGGFTCQCLTGLTGNGYICTDINECAQNTHQCSQHAACTNNHASYSCSCNAGYTGNGVNCSGICWYV